jgi:hypothetical protein
MKRSSALALGPYSFTQSGSQVKNLICYAGKDRLELPNSVPAESLRKHTVGQTQAIVYLPQLLCMRVIFKHT